MSTPIPPKTDWMRVAGLLTVYAIGIVLVWVNLVSAAIVSLIILSVLGSRFLALLVLVHVILAGMAGQAHVIGQLSRWLLKDDK